VSTDSAGDGLNRFSYVKNRPLNFADPTGHDAVFFCGTGQSCQAPICTDFGNQVLCNGGANVSSLGRYKQWVIEYWKQHEKVFQGIEEYAFALMSFVIVARGWSAVDVLNAFHVGFIDTCESRACAAGNVGSSLARYENRYWDVWGRTAGRIDTLYGYSLGGAVLARVLEGAASRGHFPDAAILIQPALNVYPTSLEARDAPYTRIMTVNGGAGALFQGRIKGAFDLTTNTCGGAIHHCTEQPSAWWVTWASMQAGATGDIRIGASARIYELDVSLSTYGPNPVPNPGPN
jgi:hypothetical protein